MGKLFWYLSNAASNLSQKLKKIAISFSILKGFVCPVCFSQVYTDDRGNWQCVNREACRMNDLYRLHKLQEHEERKK